MDIDTIKNNIISLGRNDFKKVIYLVLPNTTTLQTLYVSL